MNKKAIIPLLLMFIVISLLSVLLNPGKKREGLTLYQFTAVNEILENPNLTKKWKLTYLDELITDQTDPIKVILKKYPDYSSNQASEYNAMREIYTLAINSVITAGVAPPPPTPSTTGTLTQTGTTVTIITMPANVALVVGSVLTITGKTPATITAMASGTTGGVGTYTVDTTQSIPSATTFTSLNAGVGQLTQTGTTVTVTTVPTNGVTIKVGSILKIGTTPASTATVSAVLTTPANTYTVSPSATITTPVSFTVEQI
jgi:hypothetical protein